MDGDQGGGLGGLPNNGDAEDGFHAFMNGHLEDNDMDVSDDTSDSNVGLLPGAPAVDLDTSNSAGSQDEAAEQVHGSIARALQYGGGPSAPEGGHVAGESSQGDPVALAAGQGEGEGARTDSTSQRCSSAPPAFDLDQGAATAGSAPNSRGSFRRLASLSTSR